MALCVYQATSKLVNARVVNIIIQPNNENMNEQVKQDLKNQVSEQHKKELEALRNSQMEKVKEMEETHQNKMKELQENLENEKTKLKKDYEQYSKELEEKNQATVREKDKEIGRLEDIIQRECTRLVVISIFYLGQFQ